MSIPMRRTATALAGAALLLGASPASAVAADAGRAPEATTDIHCEAATSGHEDLDRYDGPSASYMYDRKFRTGPDLRYSELTQFTPQGLVHWKNWDGEDDLLLATAYDSGTRNAIIVGLDPAKNDKSATVGVVSIKADHAGGIAVHGDWAFVSDGPHAIATYQVSELRRAMQESKDSGTEKAPEITPAHVTEDLYGTSFLATGSSDGKLYAGLFNKDRRDWMYRYSIAADGTLSLDRKPDGDGLRWEVPRGTQGMTVVGERFLFSSSSGRNNRSNLYVTNRGETNLDKASPRCFRAPSMAEGLAIDGDEAFLLFESGSSEYNGQNGDRARNVIDGAQRAKIADLTGIPGGALHLGTLHSQKQQDDGGNDEISIRVEDQKVGETVQIGNGDRKKVDTTVQFTGNALVDLYEKDPQRHDHLGQCKLAPDAGDGIMEFTDRGGHYRLSYQVG